MTPTPARGRPATVSADDLADIALTLFLELGYDRVTMDQIATAAGVSRRTLFRYFPSKSALVWGGYEEVSDLIQLSIPAGSPGEQGSASIAEALPIAAEAMLSSLVSPLLSTPRGQSLTQRRLLLIGDVPELRADSVLRLASQAEKLAAFIGALIGEEPTALAPRVAAQALTAASIESYLYWAKHPERPLAETVRAGITLFTAPPKTSAR